MKISYFILLSLITIIYCGWHLAYSLLPNNLNNFAYIALMTMNFIVAFLPGLFCALIIFAIFIKRTSTFNINISVLFLIALIFIFASLNLFWLKNLEQFFLTLFLGFLSIKWVERNIEKYHAKET